VILITHRGSLLSLVDRVVILDSGRIMADGPKEQVLNKLASKQVA
jgi:ATP-binding cassette subfamily C protein LapB